MSEKLNLHPWLVSELHSSLQRSNQDSKPLFIGEDSISAPIVAVSVRLHCRRCGAHAYSVPVSTRVSICKNVGASLIHCERVCFTALMLLRKTAFSILDPNKRYTGDTRINAKEAMCEK